MRKRTQARELALQLLYQADQRGDDPAEESAEYLSEKTSDPEIRDFALALLRGCMEQRTELDRHIREVAANWDVSRMAVVDRNVLRLAVYELTVRRDTPPPVIINEAIEMAKRFGAKQSGGFVNGILDKVRERAERAAGGAAAGAVRLPAAGGGGGGGEPAAPAPAPAPAPEAEADAPAPRAETEEE